MHFPITMLSNTLAEREIVEGVFLIYDASVDHPRQLLGSVFTNSHRAGWEYWSKDSDCGTAFPSKAEAITAMQQAIANRARDVAMYRVGLRFRINNPAGPDYTVSLAQARAVRIGSAEIVEFNEYGGSYAT